MVSFALSLHKESVSRLLLVPSEALDWPYTEQENSPTPMVITHFPLYVSKTGSIHYQTFGRT